MPSRREQEQFELRMQIARQRRQIDGRLRRLNDDRRRLLSWRSAASSTWAGIALGLLAVGWQVFASRRGGVAESDRPRPRSLIGRIVRLAWIFVRRTSLGRWLDVLVPRGDARRPDNATSGTTDRPTAK